MRKVILFAAIGVLLLGTTLYFVHSRGRRASVSFKTSKVQSGSLVSEVSCTGTVNPVMTVKVGAEVSGKIKELLADFNSEVKRDQLIARIDPEPFESHVRQAEAELKVAKANVQIRRAAVERARAELENSRSALVVTAAVSEHAEVAAKDANRELVRMRSLHRTQSIPERRLEQVEATRDQAVAHFNATRAEQQAQENAIKSRKAHLKMEIAQLAHSEAQVEHRLASLKDARIELEHTFIRSPVDGVVISRDVDVGQTVVARFQAPLLFTIAQDLRSMQVESSVDEADIGRILAGRPASFTVDAFPGRKFSGVVDQIRKAPVTVQNVVTYTVIIATDNTHLVLLPGMTATVRVVVQELSDVLKVPNAALRFRPPETQVAAAPGNARGAASGAGETGGAKERLQRMMESLNMTEEQRAKIRSLYGQAKKRVGTLMSQGAKPEQIKAAVTSERPRILKAIQAMLTPEQKEKQARLLSERRVARRRRGRVWLQDKNGAPKSVDIVVGITDGSSSQVISGDLKEGQEVIVGVKQAGP